MAKCIIYAKSMGLALLFSASTASAATLPKLDTAISEAYAKKCASSAVHEVGLKAERYSTIANAKALELDSDGLTIRIDIELTNVVSNDNGGWTEAVQTEIRTPVTCLFANQKKGKIGYPNVVTTTHTASNGIEIITAYVRLPDNSGRYYKHYDDIKCSSKLSVRLFKSRQLKGRYVVSCDEAKRASRNGGYYVNLLYDDKKRNE